MDRPTPDHASPKVVLRHNRSEQRMIVPLRTYQRQWAKRFRNWQLAPGNFVARPCLTISECLAALTEARR